MVNEASIESECCACTEGTIESYATCADKKYVFTRREQDILGRIRENSLQARDVKEKIRRFSAGDEEETVREAELELERLRSIRQELEVERLAAAEERMRLLGHL
jgi:hypothetical protein